MLALLFALLFCHTLGKVTLPAFYGSHMVFQRDKPMVVRGWSNHPEVVIEFMGQQYTAQTKDQAFSIALPARKLNGTGSSFSIKDNDSSLVIEDVLFGDVVVCSGQSNMELQVMWTIQQQTICSEAEKYTNNIRFLTVANEDAYNNVTTPQSDFKVSLPWSRPSYGVVCGFSAVCYYYAANLLRDFDSNLVFGLVDSSWGATAMEVWMPAKSLTDCPVKGMETAAENNPDPGLAYLSGESLGLVPSMPTTLYNSMIHPLITFPISTILWYQGESNAGNPVFLRVCFPFFINSWRSAWTQGTNGATDPQLPFIFAQISSWSAGDNGVIATARYAQESGLTLPKVAMVVTADKGDPSGSIHPIHPPWKDDVGLRAALAGANIVYGDKSRPTSGPKVRSVKVYPWDASWGNYHYGIPSGLCTMFPCLGVTVTFDEEVVLASNYGGKTGYPNGFDFVSEDTRFFQPATFIGLIDTVTIQLNVTWTGSSAPQSLKTLRYGWHDYPALQIYSRGGLPVGPFNVTLPK